jgi:histidinol phosphatase-like enzyme (inositol monophosphatase family)
MADPSPLAASTIAEITNVVRDASEGSLAWFRREIPVDNKADATGGFDPVTAADRAVEDELRAALSQRFPDDRILGEERGETGQGVRRWVIDPIDGTRAFVSGSVLWGTLVGLQQGADVLAGWMHVPAIGETYVGTTGEAWLETAGDRRELRVSGTVDLAEATLCATHPEMFSGAGEWAAFERVAAVARLTRYGGDCTNYGLLALGTIDLVVESGLNPYDIMALIPIIEGAGGVVTDRAGARAVDGGFIVAAATPELHAAALALINEETS